MNLGKENEALCLTQSSSFCFGQKKNPQVFVDIKKKPPVSRVNLEESV